jgi:hypothetical protein
MPRVSHPMKITLEELKKIPYLDTGVIGDRTVKLMPLWNGEGWRMWFDTEIGIIEGKIVDALESDYVAKSAAKDTDLFIPFVHLMWQHASFPEIVGLISSISDDFHNMGTSVAKLKHFWKFQSQIERGGVVRFASTELEYLVALCRTVFDLLQETFSRLWAGRVRLVDEEAEKFRKAHSLPDTFSKMVLEQKDRPRTAEEIMSKFGLPQPLAEQYAGAAIFFAELRQTRDKVIHDGGNFRAIYETERGFCVNPKDPPFHNYKEWKSEHQFNENISTLLPWLADLILRTIETCNALVGTFAQTIVLPSAIAPGYFVFVRGPHTDALASLLRVTSEENVWWSEGTPAGGSQ